MPYIGESVHLVGYRVRIERRAAFRVRGYTRIVPPGRAGEGAIPTFWRDVAADGRLARLVGASVVRPWVLDLGSWDPECEHGGQRYTICIEETPHTDFSGLERGGATSIAKRSEPPAGCVSRSPGGNSRAVLAG